MIAREIFDHASSPEIGKQNAVYFKLFVCFGLFLVWFGFVLVFAFFFLMRSQK